MIVSKKLWVVLSLFLCVSSLYAQGKIERAVKERKEGSVKTHVIPMVDDVWGEIDGWVRSPYRTIYPHHGARISLYYQMGTHLSTSQQCV